MVAIAARLRDGDASGADAALMPPDHTSGGSFEEARGSRSRRSAPRSAPPQASLGIAGHDAQRVRVAADHPARAAAGRAKVLPAGHVDVDPGLVLRRAEESRRLR